MYRNPISKCGVRLEDLSAVAVHLAVTPGGETGDSSPNDAY